MRRRDLPVPVIPKLGEPRKGTENSVRVEWVGADFDRFVGLKRTWEKTISNKTTIKIKGGCSSTQCSKKTETG